MIEVLINYMPDKECYGVYEPSTDTLLVSSNLSEALVSLSNFLKDSKMIDTDILNTTEIKYHLDSHTMKSIIESNVNLMKRLNNAPSGFMISSQRFGSSMTQNNNSRNEDFKKTKFDKTKKFGNSGFGGRNKNFSSFSGDSKFAATYRKFGRQ